MEALQGEKAMSRTAFLSPVWGLHWSPALRDTFRVYRPGRRAGLSISGYDPVAYFTDGKPVPGKPDLEYLWHKLRWRFASAEHRDLFSKDPEHYAPQYDGYCAMGAAERRAAHKDTVDPEAWAIVDGKLYLVHNSYWLAKWQEQAKEYIKRADADWQVVADLPAPTIVGPPCAASPPTTAVALRDGGKWLVVGGQVARDAAGNVVGKGDMRAQIEQVGKNVGCVPQGRRGNRQQHRIYGKPCRGARRIRQIRRSAPALFRPALTEEHDRHHAAIIQSGLAVAGRGHSRRSSEPGRLV